MNIIYYMFLNLRNYITFISITSILCFSIIVKAQNYPEDLVLSSIIYDNYQPPTGPLPGYLQPFTESLSGNTVTRISDAQTFGISNQRLKHHYAKDQTWNSDESLIKLSGYPAAILDGDSYEFLFWADIPSSATWSNSEPNVMYGTEFNRFVKYDVQTNSRTILHQFDDFEKVSYGFGEGNMSIDDRWVGLIGENGNDLTLIVYDVLNDIITGTKFLGSEGDLDWFSMSQSGNYAVALWRTNGSGSTEGLKAYDVNLNNETHIVDQTEHGDLGIDVEGNDVYVGFFGNSAQDQGYYLVSARLDGGPLRLLFNYSAGVWGGHISCRNTDRPGWAYVSEGCCTDHPVAPREIFAIKLDDSNIVERFAKHHTDNHSYGHAAMAVPNRNGTKIMFGSNWNNAFGGEYAPSFIVEVPQDDNVVQANAGNNISICEGESTTLTASGGTDYLWSTGETTQSITVSPNTTTTYSVTVSNSSSSDTDDVIVTVTALPIANAGIDVTIEEGQNTTLTASGGNSYLWSTGESSQSIIVSPNTTTTYSVTVSQNECTDSDEVLVTVVSLPSVNAGNDVTICEGSSTTLSATGNGSFLWNTGETTQTITVSPTSTTTYSISVTNGISTVTDEVVVNVNPLPLANAGDDVTINQGENVTLSASGGDTYQWNTGETTQDITVNPNSTTTYDVTIAQNGCTASDDIEVTVLITETVTANAGNDVSICEEDSTTLTASGGTDYLWNTGETTQSISVSPNATTIYTVTVSNETSSDSDEVVVEVNPIPVANGGDDVTIEEGQNVTLTASGGSSYLWNTGETSQSITVSPNITTTYSITVTHNGCSASDDIEVTVIEPSEFIANAGDDVSICEGESTTLTASGGTEYLWNTGDATQSITVSPNHTTVYTVSVLNGLVTKSDKVKVTVNKCAAPFLDTGQEEEIKTVEFKVYPNPTHNIINIKLSGLYNVSSLHLFDILGKSLLNEAIDPSLGQSTTRVLDLSAYPRGIYLLTIIQNGMPFTKKIILN